MISNKHSTYKNDLAACQQGAFKHVGNRNDYKCGIP